MKKVLLFITMACALLFAQCKKSEESAPSAGRPVEMTVTVGPGSKTDIASTGGITWSAGDKLYVGYDGKYVGYLTLESGEGGVTGMFTGSVGLTDADEGKELTFHFYYLGSADHTSLAKGATSVEVDFSSQNIIKGTDGKLTNASSQHVCYGSAKGTVTDGTVTDINVVLVSKVAIACFDFKNSSAAYAGALVLRGDNIYSTMTVNFDAKDGFSFSGTKGGIILTNTSTSEKYVMLVPTGSNSEDVTFTGNGVSGTTTLANGIKPNKFYGLDGAIAVTVNATKYVDLGLPSGLLWATCNVGANNPQGYGWKFMWGSVMENGDPTCTWENCPGNGKSSTYNETAFTTWKSSNLTAESVLKPGVDAAHMHKDWGGDWRMPTSAEFQELYNSTNREWITLVDVPGWKFASKSVADLYVFFPAAGSYVGTQHSDYNVLGVYWSSSLSSNFEKAFNMGFSLSNIGVNETERYCGYSVRPVRPAR